ncbi:MAG: hypothetical protein GOVbin2390_30 [Prokaryotic dsDNA virus sp.]|nr:MAG: hypothetical protein GOVbin2390_30 [Prokaryotic dsDNA virus sp.]|tara:strand:+ start:9334 stop:10251 length:918 start_codon:yes stop_codon:yes gene_type:complete
MAFNVTSNFSGKAAGFYIAAALKETKSLDFLTLIENIKFKSNIQRMAGSSVVRDATCDFTDHGTLAMTEKVLEPKNLQVNLDLCKKTLLSSWEALEMRAGAGSPPPPSFEDYVISYMGEIIADAAESSIWSGVAANNGEFAGFLGTATGYLLPGVDGTVIQSSASGAYTAANIIANLQTLTADMAANISPVLRKEDLYIYMNPKTYAFYISAVSTLGYVNAYNMNGDYEPVFEGYKIAVCPGMVDNQLVAATRSNLFAGTDLLSDTTRIALLDMSNLDGSDNIRVVAKYSMGVQTGVGADIVRQS